MVLHTATAEESWIEQTISKFFEARKFPTRRQCDQFALSITGASTVSPVDVPSSLSYTVLCNRPQIQKQQQENTVVVSFRQLESRLNRDVVKMALAGHGPLVPLTKDHGTMERSHPPLGVYTMSLLPGVPCLEAFSHEIDMNPDDEIKHAIFITHLARYDKRYLHLFSCWQCIKRLL